MNKYGSTQTNPGCLGVNKVTDVKKTGKNTYRLNLGLYGVKNRAGQLIPALSERLIGDYNAKEDVHRIMTFKAIGSDSHRGDAVSTVMRRVMDDVCGVISNVSIHKTAHGQQLVGDVTVIGPKAKIFESYFDDPCNVIHIGHRLITQAEQNGSGQYDPKKHKIVDIIGFDVIGNVV